MQSVAVSCNVTKWHLQYQFRLLLQKSWNWEYVVIKRNKSYWFSFNTLWGLDECCIDDVELRNEWKENAFEKGHCRRVILKFDNSWERNKFTWFSNHQQIWYSLDRKNLSESNYLSLLFAWIVYQLILHGHLQIWIIFVIMVEIVRK